MLINIFNGDGVVTLILKSAPPAFSTLKTNRRRQSGPSAMIHHQHSSIFSRYRTGRLQQSPRADASGISLSQKIQERIHLKEGGLRLKRMRSDLLRLEWRNRRLLWRHR